MKTKLPYTIRYSVILKVPLIFNFPPFIMLNVRFILTDDPSFVKGCFSDNFFFIVVINDKLNLAIQRTNLIRVIFYLKDKYVWKFGDFFLTWKIY